jgi:peptidoglycan/xylan/chitin deacetylase (PgdA/CDA1 family)
LESRLTTKAGPVLKRWTLSTAEKLGAYAVCRSLCRRWLAVLCYHGVISHRRKGWQDLFTFLVDVSEFTAQLEYICRHFTPVSGSELRDALLGNRAWPRNPVLVTFDDGYRNNVTVAAPILKRMGVPAVFHLTTAYLGATSMLWTTEIRLRVLDWPEDEIVCALGRYDLKRCGPDRHRRLGVANRLVEQCKRVCPEAREQLLVLLRSKTEALPSLYDEEAHAFMDWEEARWLSRQGFELGSHTVSHPVLTSLGTEAVESELRESRQAVVAGTGAPCDFLAYPNGSPADYSAEVMRLAEQAGYQAAFSVEDRHAGRCPLRWAIPRLRVYHGMPPRIFRAKVSGLYALAGREG